MPDPKKLPFLLRLLDDESREVQEALLKEFMAYGPDLEKQLLTLQPPPDERQKKLIIRLLDGHRRHQLREAWPSWFSLVNDYEKIEAALSLLADYQSQGKEAGRLTALLDEIAKKFRSAHPQGNAYTLAQFFHNNIQLRGVLQENYMNPANSNLIHVLETGKGIPISLACLYMLVGYRLNIDIEGCNFPGHFLARVRVGDRLILVDCFHDWKFIDEKDIEYTESTQDLEQVIKAETPAEVIVGRVLTNLIRAYETAGEEENASLMQGLLGMLGGTYSE